MRPLTRGFGRMQSSTNGGLHRFAWSPSPQIASGWRMWSAHVPSAVSNATRLSGYEMWNMQSVLMVSMPPRHYQRHLPSMHDTMASCRTCGHDFADTGRSERNRRIALIAWPVGTRQRQRGAMNNV